MRLRSGCAHCVVDELINYLKKFEPITVEQANFIRHHAHAVILRRGDILLEAEQVPQQLTFIVDGVLSASTCSGGRDIIRYFMDKMSFTSDVDAFLQRIPARVCIQAVIDSRLLSFTRENVHALSKTLTNWDNLRKNLSINDMLEIVNKRKPVSGGDACSKLLEFETRYPGLSKRIPQSVVATYLDLAPGTLSRVKKKLT